MASGDPCFPNFGNGREEWVVRDTSMGDAADVSDSLDDVVRGFLHLVCVRSLTIPIKAEQFLQLASR